MVLKLYLTILCVVFNFVYLTSSELSSSGYDFPESSTKSETCAPQKYGTEWMWEQRNSNYGWYDQTPRVVITLFTAIAEGKIKYIKAWEQELMIHQLELQLAVALLKPNTDFTQNEISLYIHALLISGVNPRNFQGVDLIEKLKIAAGSKYSPLTMLCLCNARVKDFHYMHWLKYLINQWKASDEVFDVENGAMLLNAYACVISEGLQNEVVENAITIAHHLASLQNENGGFGNLFTTAIVTHALKVFDHQGWNQVAANEYLEKYSESSMLAIYFVEMAFRKTAFIKDIAPKTAFGDSIKDDNAAPNEVKYSIKIGNHPSTFHTITLKVPSITVLELMERAANESENFRFSYHMQGESPFVYSIAGISNNPEDGLFWKLEEFNRNEIRPRNPLRNDRLDTRRVRNGNNFIYSYLPLQKDYLHKM